MPTPLENDFTDAMLGIYRRAKDEADYTASYFLPMVLDRGGREAARHLLHTVKPSDGFTALWERKRLDLTVERLVLEPKWEELFTEAERRIAVQRLLEYEYSDPLVDALATN